jgi:uncharacterized protein (DUF58 family)
MEPHYKAQTNIEQALKFLNNVMKKRAITFLLSDFLSAPYKDSLNVAGKRHDIIGINVFDKRDRELPPVGMMKVQDAESGKMVWVDTSSKLFQQRYKAGFEKQEQLTKETFLKSGSSFVPIQTDEDYVKKLQLFFKGRR